jgi:hypothetical protein
MVGNTGTNWKLRHVSWRRVLSQQDWGSLISTITVLIVFAITDAALGGPRARPFQVTDSTISYPYG